jgi:hypothetical protein
MNIVIETFDDRLKKEADTTTRFDESVDDAIIGRQVAALVREMASGDGHRQRRIVLTIAPEPVVSIEKPPHVPVHASFLALDAAERAPILIGAQKAATVLNGIQGPAPTAEDAATKLPKGSRVVFWDYYDNAHTFDRVAPLAILDVTSDGTTVGDVAICMRAVQDVAAQKNGRVVGKRLTVPFRPLEDPEDVLWLHGIDPGEVVPGHLKEHVEITSFSAFAQLGSIYVQLIGDTWVSPKRRKPVPIPVRSPANRLGEGSRQSLSDLASLTLPPEGR